MFWTRLISLQFILFCVDIGTRFVQCFYVLKAVMLKKTSFFSSDVDVLEDLAKRKLCFEYVASVNNATGGLTLAYKALQRDINTVLINPLVIPSNYTGALECGLTVKAAKIDPKTLNFDLEAIDFNQIDLICVTHYFGYTCDMRRLEELCHQHKVKLIEDCSHCHGGEFNGRPLGSFGDIAVFSLQGSKFISGGEGGLVCCKNEATFKKICKLAYQDKWVKRYERQSAKIANESYDFGLKYRIHPLAAALARVDLITLNFRNKIINEILLLLKVKRPYLFLKEQQGLKLGGFCNGFVLVRNFENLRGTYTRDYIPYLESLEIKITENEKDNLQVVQQNLTYTNSSYFTNPLLIFLLLQKTQ
jgi:hypothetical protein